jgi:hypothetical protein
MTYYNDNVICDVVYDVINVVTPVLCVCYVYMIGGSVTHHFLGVASKAVNLK